MRHLIAVKIIGKRRTANSARILAEFADSLHSVCRTRKSPFRLVSYTSEIDIFRFGSTDISDVSFRDPHCDQLPLAPLWTSKRASAREGW